MRALWSCVRTNLSNTRIPTFSLSPSSLISPVIITQSNWTLALPIFNTMVFPKSLANWSISKCSILPIHYSLDPFEAPRYLRISTCWRKLKWVAIVTIRVFPLKLPICRFLPTFIATMHSWREILNLFWTCQLFVSYKNNVCLCVWIDFVLICVARKSSNLTRMCDEQSRFGWMTIQILGERFQQDLDPSLILCVSCMNESIYILCIVTSHSHAFLCREYLVYRMFFHRDNSHRIGNVASNAWVVVLQARAPWNYLNRICLTLSFFTTLEQIWLFDNELTGTVPTEIGGLQFLSK